MHVDTFILQICEFLDNGDGMYRFHAPSHELSLIPGVGVVDIDLWHRFLPELAEAADVLILAGFDWDFFPLLERRRAAGRVTVFEANDYYDDIHPWNPLSTRWLDRGLQSSFYQGLLQADGVQTSTHELERRWRLRTPKPVRAFPNQLTEIPPLPPVPDRPLTIGWGGSPGHFADWYAVAPYLERWLRDHPQVHLAVMNHEYAKTFIDLPPERYHYQTFGSLAQYQQFLRRLDIGIAPLLPSGYNSCRSDVKFLEYASQGVAGIYSDLEPYQGIVVDGETGLFFRNPAELIARLDLLANDAALRQKIRTQAHDYIAKHRRLEQHAGDRLEFYRELLPGPPKGYTFRPEVLQAARCDGRYLQLQPQEPEQILKRTQSAPRPEDSVNQLRQLVTRYPAYLPALQQLGQQLNDRGESFAAMEVLERARTMQPHSARTLAEMGRSCFRNRQNEDARRLLEQALTINPLFLPGWQYLLRLLDVTKSSDGWTWAEKACQQHPQHYALALLGMKLYPRTEIVARIRGLLEKAPPTFLAEEQPLAAAAFSETIRDLYPSLPKTPELLSMLELACETFPGSALLAHICGHALHKAGRLTDSYTYHTRALIVHRNAQTFRSEFPKREGTLHFWQFAEHIQERIDDGRWTAEEKPK